MEYKLTDQEVARIKAVGGNVAEAQEAKKQAYLKAHPNTMEYTKGEWEITFQHPGVWGIWAKQEGIRIGIADVFHTTDDMGEANAQLIASAPKMYEALSLVAKGYESSKPNENFIKQMVFKVLAELGGK